MSVRQIHIAGDAWSRYRPPVAIFLLKRSVKGSMFMQKIKRLTVCLLIVLFAAYFSTAAGLLPSGESFPTTAHAGFFDNELEIFEEVVDLVAARYVYPPDYRRMYEAALNQMFASVGEENLSLQDKGNGKVVGGKNFRIEYDLNYDPNHNMKAFKKVYRFLLDEMAGEITEKDLETAAVTGLMNSLDPYSQFLDESAFDKSMRDTEGKYGGLGMIVTTKNGRLLVVRTMKNGPAERAGMLPEDQFLKVNGQDTKNWTIHDLAETLRGYPNTQVTVTLYRPGDRQERFYNLTREIISVETVTYRTLKDHIGYVKISSFSKQTNDQLKEALAQAKANGVQGFILDLRDNPGGLLNQSVKVSSHFLYRGRLIVYTQGRAKSDYKEYRAQYKNSLLHMPVVILINRHSASASEIVAGALRDSGKALIIGENSYGKGSVQTIFRISDGSGLRLTTSKYYTPSGIDITEHGIVPEIKIIQDDHYPEASNGNAEASLGAKQVLESYGGHPPAVLLKESELNKYLKENGSLQGENADPSVQFARMLLKNLTVANKKQTLQKAREIAANILY